MNIAVNIDIPAQRIADIMIGAMEQNHMTRSWVAAVRLRTPSEADVLKRYEESNWYASPQLWANEFEIDVFEISDESIYDGGFDPEADPELDIAELAELGLTKHAINRKDLDEGLRLMASTKHAHHFGDFLHENDDAITADVLLQLVTLKDVIYG